MKRELERLISSFKKELGTIKNIKVVENINIIDSRDIVFTTILNEIKDFQKEWETNLKEKLNDKLPLKYKGKKRPQNRVFPYLVSGKLKDSVSTDIFFKHKVKSDVITARFKVEHKHAYFTNLGITGKNISKGKWVGWLIDSFGNGRKMDGAYKGINNILSDRLQTAIGF